MRIYHFLLLTAVINCFASCKNNTTAQQQEKTDSLTGPILKRTMHTNGLYIASEKEMAQIPISLYFSQEDKVKLIPKIDLSNVLPPAGDQGYIPTCVPWVLAYDLRSAQEKSIRKWDYNIKNNIPGNDRVFSPSYVFNLVMIKKYKGKCSKGMSFEDAMNVVRDNGYSFLKDFAYDGNSSNCGNNPLSTITYGSNYSNVGFDRIAKDQQILKSYLAQKYPVILGISVDNKFEDDGFTAFEKKLPFIYHMQGASTGLHAVLCVGYDDDKKLFKIMNSYGWNWGENGYFYIPYDRFNAIVRQAYVGWVTSININSLSSFSTEKVVMYKNKEKLEKFKAKTEKDYSDFRLINIGYDSINNFSIFSLLRNDLPSVNFVLRNNEKKLINVDEKTSLQLQFSSIDSLKAGTPVIIRIERKDYKTDYQILDLKNNLRKDLKDLSVIQSPTESQKELMSTIEKLDSE